MKQVKIMFDLYTHYGFCQNSLFIIIDKFVKGI